MSFHLRPAEPADGPGLIKLIIGLAKFENLEAPDESAQARLLSDAFSQTPRFEAWLACLDGCGEAVGYAIFFPIYSTFLARPSLYIEDIFVLPEHRRRGIGSALLRKAIELAHERGCGRVEWTALDWNVNAQRVYEGKLGARRMNEWYLYRMTSADMDRFLKQNGS